MAGFVPQTLQSRSVGAYGNWFIHHDAALFRSLVFADAHISGSFLFEPLLQQMYRDRDPATVSNVRNRVLGPP